MSGPIITNKYKNTKNYSYNVNIHGACNDMTEDAMGNANNAPMRLNNCPPDNISATGWSPICPPTDLGVSTTTFIIRAITNTGVIIITGIKS